MCVADITIDDLKNSLLSMENNKSPGNDGLTKEFYVFFWDSIRICLYNSLMEAKTKGELSASQKQAIIKLLEKKDRYKIY